MESQQREATTLEIQGFIASGIRPAYTQEVDRKESDERNKAALMLQGSARRRAAEREVRRRKTQKQEALRRREHEAHAAATRIQTFTRRQMREREEKMIRAEKRHRHKTATALQRVARLREVEAKVDKLRKGQRSERSAARNFVEGVASEAIEYCARSIEQERHRSAKIIQKMARTRARRTAHGVVEALERNVAARRLQALAKRRLKAIYRRRGLEQELFQDEKQLAETVAKEALAMIKLQRTTREYDWRKITEPLRRRSTEATALKPPEDAGSAGSGYNR